LESRPVPAADAAAPKSRSAPTPTMGDTQSITSNATWQFAPTIPRQSEPLPSRIKSLVTWNTHIRAKCGSSFLAG
jgi:hypothetical protein